jgi:Kelch motif protein
MSRCTTLAAALLAAGVLLTVAALAQAGHWTTDTPMPSSRTEVAVAEVSGKIYVVGGFRGGTYRGSECPFLRHTLVLGPAWAGPSSFAARLSSARVASRGPLSR